MALLSHRHYVAVAHMLLFIGRQILFSGHQQQLGRVAVVPAEEDLSADEQQHVRDGDVVPVREERHP